MSAEVQQHHRNTVLVVSSPFIMPRTEVAATRAVAPETQYAQEAYPQADEVFAKIQNVLIAYDCLQR